MKVFKPQLMLTRKTNGDFNLLSITHADNTHYIADGFDSLPEEPDEDGKFKVVVYIKKEPTIPDMLFVAPISHAIALGQIELDENNPYVEVMVKETGQPNILGISIIYVEDAEDDPRPLP